MDLLNYKEVVNSDTDRWVVFVHGAGGGINTWKYQIEDFKPFFNILLVDLRDHGLSKNIIPASDKYNFGLISEDIRKVLDYVGIKNADFVTLSFGSVMMQDFSHRYPHMIGSVVFGGAIFRGNVWIKSFVNLARFFNLFLSYQKMYSFFSYLLMPRKRNQIARRIYQMQSRKLSQKEYMKWIGLYGEFFRLLKNFYDKQFKIRSLVIMGSDDFVFLKAARSFAKRQPLVKMEVIKDAGHVCNIDEYSTFNRLAIDFLRTK